MFSSVLLLKQAFEQAESNNGLTLTTNLAATEDIGLLEAVEQWDRSVHGSSGSAPPLSARASVVRASPSRTLRPVGMTQDPRLIADLQGARDDNASLQERFQRMQVQTQQILREKSELQAQVEAMSSGSSDETEALRAQVEQLQAELQAAWFVRLPMLPLLVSSRVAAVRADLLGPRWGKADSLWWNIGEWHVAPNAGPSER
jgi:hypothetical protein